MINRTALTLSLIICAGCASHMHRVVNTGDQMLYAVAVDYDGTNFGHGYLPPGAEKGYHGSMKIAKHPAPVVSWKMTEKGITISNSVHLSRAPAPWQEVVFELDGKTVTPRLIPR